VRLPWLVSCIVLGLTFLSGGPVLASRPSSPPVLLVHGILFDLECDDGTWGRQLNPDSDDSGWSGMIGFLESRGLSYGGAIRPSRGRIRLPDQLDTRGVRAQPRNAKVFVLKFSPYANTDGLGYKAAELAEAVKQVCRFTGARKVRIVGHSAGGLVARVYLQSALPGVEYRHDVDRLITLNTPHLGSALASHWGDFLGTRATSIKPEAPLMRDLNWKFDLPDDTTFVSIVVRGLATDSRSRGEELSDLVDRVFLTGLPVEYRTGGDDVVHVQSQNLRLAKCAARYEQRTGRPIQYVLARVLDDTPNSIVPSVLRVHVTSPNDRTVQHLVAGLLSDRALLWSKADPAKMADWLHWQAQLHATGVIEAEALDDHPMSQVSAVRIENLDLISARSGSHQYALAGKAWSENAWIPFRKRWTHVEATMNLQFDDFGRVKLASSVIR
jgi:pimeloyl-ACP methyl ester carboxylesterase